MVNAEFGGIIEEFDRYLLCEARWRINSMGSVIDIPFVRGVSDLVVVCANCHLLIHLDPKKALSVQRLRKRLRANGS